ncbi:hypothetical protein GOEFS_069_00280 [Gordonia effusa NBRC 100432]|uniref:HTH cro/C1-type domain-containing protein n=1 Tax=Gordonia effusa NBRC 100432 TaxID=1077974 RepID=H0R1F1_9ACTN|nr:helix-turn-helix transcriptional regulator [Gordonia effusa]GAB18902.1 hypothetical protein GOEFS_069_00280 [Gordonia effusa NBRC 100432]
MTQEPAPTTASSDISNKLEHLFTVVRNPDGSRIKQSEVVARAAAVGVEFSEGYLSHLRTGRVKSPSFKAVEGLAAAFGVDIEYFAVVEPTGGVLHDAGVERTAYRLAGLPSEDLDVINDMITAFRARRNLPPASDNN